MIPWIVSEQFRQYDFGELSGGRVVRIATHPDFQRAGYGKEAIKQLEQYYRGNIPLKGKPSTSTHHIIMYGPYFTEYFYNQSIFS